MWSILYNYNCKLNDIELLMEDVVMRITILMYCSTYKSDSSQCENFILLFKLSYQSRVIFFSNKHCIKKTIPYINKKWNEITVMKLLDWKFIYYIIQVLNAYHTFLKPEHLDYNINCNMLPWVIKHQQFRFSYTEILQLSTKQTK